MIVLGGPVDLDTLRLRNEFLSMPGLSITRPQVARLLGVRLDHARAMLEELEHEGFLVCDADGDYRRAAVVFARELEHPVRNP
jgi:Fic family protein